MLIRAPTKKLRGGGTNIPHCNFLPLELELELCRMCTVARRVAYD